MVIVVITMVVKLIFIISAMEVKVVIIVNVVKVEVNSYRHLVVNFGTVALQATETKSECHYEHGVVGQSLQHTAHDLQVPSSTLPNYT